MKPLTLRRPAQLIAGKYRPGVSFCRCRNTYATSAMDSASKRVAVLHQAIPPPVVNNVRKPVKPGGYRDSSADIAYVLQQAGVSIVTPSSNAQPENEADWSFPDSEEGILAAVRQGATCIWANTILFEEHPVQAAASLSKQEHEITVVGQPPNLVQLYDDKNVLNNLLRENGGFTLPQSYIVTATDLDSLKIPVPAVGKPIRGRGSHGVKLCHTETELHKHLASLLEESPEVMVEQYLAGQEVTVTVMPPTGDGDDYWTLPVVERFNHDDGIAPYSGKTAVTANSRAIPSGEQNADKAYGELTAQCTSAARLLQMTAPIRIDARRFGAGTDFALFDVNMKPNMTGPGRPGRSDQSSLTAMAAAAIGWNYSDLLQAMLRTATPLQRLRAIVAPPPVKIAD